MKTYQCHKRVEAARITGIERIDRHFDESRLPFADRVPHEIHTSQIAGRENSVLWLDGGAHVIVDHRWMQKNEPKVPGYFVRYENGYTAWSPAGAFESGYTEVVDPA